MFLKPLCRCVNVITNITIRLSTIVSKKNVVPVNLSYSSFEVPGPSTQPPIFIFHGVMGNRTRWEELAKDLYNITQRTVVAVDLRNHGESPHTDSHKHMDQVADVLQLFEKLGTREACLMGYSIGGRTAMCVALTAPKKVAGLLVIDISPISTPTILKRDLLILMKAMKNVDFRNARNVPMAKKAAKKQLTKYVKDIEEMLMLDVLCNIGKKPDGSFGWLINLDALIRDHKHWMSFPRSLARKSYDGPTLFLGGQLSEFIPPDELNMIRTMFPSAVVSYIVKTGHYVYHNNPSMFLRAAVYFLDRHQYRHPVEEDPKKNK